jgi:Tol biopolymer transport system component
MLQGIGGFAFALGLSIVGTFGLPANADSATDLASKMRDMHVRIVAFGAGGMIDEYPHWSGDSSKLAFNIQGEWQELKLASLILGKADWAGQTIGYVTDAVVANEISEDMLSSYIANSDPSASEVKLSDGTKVSMAGVELGTSLTIHPVGSKLETVFQTHMDNCFAPTPSPDGKFVAFICDGAGLFLALVK